MGHVTFARAAFHWKSAAFAGLPVTSACGNKSCMKRLIDLEVGRRQPAVHGTQQVAFIEHGPARGIAVDDLSPCIDEKNRGAQTVEHVGKSGRFRLA